MTRSSSVSMLCNIGTTFESPVMKSRFVYPHEQCKEMLSLLRACGTVSLQIGSGPVLAVA